MDSVSAGARASGAQLERKAAPMSGEDCSLQEVGIDLAYSGYDWLI